MYSYPSDDVPQVNWPLYGGGHRRSRRAIMPPPHLDDADRVRESLRDYDAAHTSTRYRPCAVIFSSHASAVASSPPTLSRWTAANAPRTAGAIRLASPQT